jgi:arylsulfatase A-like enzyme
VVTNPNVSSRNLGFEEGFEDFYAAFGDRDDQFEIGASEFHGWVEEWLDRHAHQPFFLYVHSVDPHSPYTPEEPDWRRFDPDYAGTITGSHEGPGAFKHFATPTPDDVEHIEALYDAEIVENDRALLDLANTLRRMDLWEHSGWILTSDHGEEFQERGGWLHGERAWQEQVHVPLVVKPASGWGVTPRRSRHRVQISDIAPTLVELLDLAGEPALFSGDSFADVLRGARTDDPDRSLYLDERPAVHSLITGAHKLVVESPDSRVPRASLYDLRADPDETHDLAAERADLVPELQQRIVDRLGEFEDRGLQPAPIRGRVAVMSEEEINTLMALGYLDTGPREREEPEREDSEEGAEDGARE